MHKCYQVPQQSKDKPGASEGGSKQEKLVAPLHVQKGCPQVAQVKRPSAADVLDAYIAPPIFR